MLKSILVALDGSASSLRAARIALALSRRHGAHVKGLGIVNSAWIQRPEPVPVGGTALKKALDLRALESANERVEAVLDLFRQEARDAEAASLEAEIARGNPLDVIETAAVAHDLVVIGRNSRFDVDEDMQDVPQSVDRVIRGEPRPMLLVPPSANGNGENEIAGPTLIAFDGSPAASRALHMFALLGIGRDRAVKVLTVNPSSEQAATETAVRACALLERHGFTQVEPMGLGNPEAGRPAEAILEAAKVIHAGMIVMGAYGHSGIRELFGSCTRDVLNNSTAVLFLHH
jgi:nucleotide-binding universal stress UspA family protein